MPTSPPRHNAHKVQAKRAATQADYTKKRRVNAKFYNSKTWKRLRLWHIRQQPLCVRCKENGRAVDADVVDHMHELRDGGSALDSNNLQSLCHHHHNRKSALHRTQRKKNIET